MLIGMNWWYLGWLLLLLHFLIQINFTRNHTAQFIICLVCSDITVFDERGIDSNRVRHWQCFQVHILRVSLVWFRNWLSCSLDRRFFFPLSFHEAWICLQIRRKEGKSVYILLQLFIYRNIWLVQLNQWHADCHVCILIHIDRFLTICLTVYRD